MEIRIFYECLEQALHYILPMVKNSLKILNIKCDVKLIKSVKRPEFFQISKLQGIHRLTTPDFLITVVNDKIETPLIIGEFSEAVSTEDHELQREFGSVAACLSNIIFLKISGNKISPREHGGAYYDRYTTPKIYKEQFGYHGYILAEWPTVESNNALLQRKNNCLSCPVYIPLVETTILKTLEAFVHNPNSTDIVSDILKLMSNIDCYKNFLNKVNSAPGLSKLEQNWKERKVSETRRRFWVSDNDIKIKVYRFSHAMDPDRGILVFVSFVETALKKNVWVVYNLESKGHQGTIDTIEEIRKEFIEKLKKDKMPSWFINEMRKVITNKNLTMESKIDITNFWKQRINEIQNNKVFTTLVYFSDGMFINRNGPLLYWDRLRLFGCKRSKFIETLRKIWGFDINVTPAKLREVSNTVDEDEVTYTIIHKILLPNNFKIISVSYPGAQGSTVILPEKNKGREQKRQYHDIIALPPCRSIKTIEPMIEESKGMFNESELSKAVKELVEFKETLSTKDALKEMLIQVDAKYKNSQILHILIGVGFGVDTKIHTLWNPGKVDFIVRLENRQNWSIGIFNQHLLGYIPKISGKTDLPIVYEVVPFFETKQAELF